MTKGQTIRLGWDAPLEVDWDFQLEELRREIEEVAPLRSGALRDAFRNADTAVINKEKNLITIEVGQQHRAWPYAAIQNFGGPARDIIIRPRFAKALKFFWKGRLRFFAKVTMHAGQIVGSYFVEEGVFNWYEKLTGGTYTVVHWRSKHYAKPMEYGRGISSE